MVLVIGHRGASSLEPENTLRSFFKAASIGADMVELDVHLTDDGHLAVIHDNTVDRTTNGTGRVGSFNLKELKELDAGKGERIPTLEEVLRELAGRVQVNIELKGPGTAAAVHERMNDLISYGYSRGDLLLSSFSPVELMALFELSSENARAILVDGRPDGAEEFAIEIGCEYVHPRHDLTSKKYIEICHSLGLKVNVWTIEGAEVMRRFVEMGVNGLITDDPKTAIDLLDEMDLVSRYE